MRFVPLKALLVEAQLFLKNSIFCLDRGANGCAENRDNNNFSVDVLFSI